MKRLSIAWTLLTALAAVAAASTQPDEHTQFNLAAAATTQALAGAIDDLSAPLADPTD